MPKTILLSGATSGIGLAIYERLISLGNNVVVVMRDTSNLNVFSKPPYRVLKADFAKPISIEQAFEGFSTPIHALINVCGVLHGNSYAESDANTLEELFNVNVISPILLLKYSVPMLTKGSSVILFGSISGHKGSYDDGYAASKGAIHTLVRSMASKLAPNIRVNGIAPGMIQNTGMTDSLVAGRFEHNLNLIPTQKAGQPQDIAELVEFMLSDANQFMTGNIVDLNGGQYLRT
ncbi:MAG: SDR family oxidoreductase [Hyphomicrobiales bacterium]